MAQRIRAAFIRGGTSKAVVFHKSDLPTDRKQWDQLFLKIMGSPDPYGRQLDGMGGGVSSLSKVCVVGPATHPEADVDYTFVQVGVKKGVVDYKGNCGNMSAAIGPFAVDEGLIQPKGQEALVRIHNTNTGKIIHARFPLRSDGHAEEAGSLAIPGVTGTGAPIKLQFLNPGGAITGRLLPTGKPLDLLEVAGMGKVRASLVDAANACCFVLAQDLGLKGCEMPAEIESNGSLLGKLEAIRQAASVAMGITKSLAEAARNLSIPFIGFVSPTQPATTASGSQIDPTHINLTARMMSSGQLHRALPLAGSLCMAVASAIEGTTVHMVTRQPAKDQPLVIAMPSGELHVAAEVQRNPQWRAVQGTFYRTQRRLFDGHIYPRL